MLQRLTINLSKPEQDALEKVAAIEIRDMREQARFILRQELERRGFLQVDPTTADNEKPHQEELSARPCST